MARGVIMVFVGLGILGFAAAMPTTVATNGQESLDALIARDARNSWTTEEALAKERRGRTEKAVVEIAEELRKIRILLEKMNHE